MLSSVVLDLQVGVEYWTRKVAERLSLAAQAGMPPSLFSSIHILGLPLGSSGLPLGSSGLPLGSSGLPLGSSGLPLTSWRLLVTVCRNTVRGARGSNPQGTARGAASSEALS